MTAPFPPAGTPGPDDEPQLRGLLQAEARRQPPVSADLRAGVDRRVRRQRARVAVIGLPVVAAVALGGAALVAAAPDAETTLQTASGGQEASTDQPDAGGPAATPVQDCGAVELGPDRLDPETGPLDCFIAAFNGGTRATVTVLVHGPDGGTITQQVTTAPDKQVSVTVDGSVSMALPNLSLGSGDGIVPSESAGDRRDCGSVTVTEGESLPEVPEDTTRCLADLVLKGDAGGFRLNGIDRSGQTMVVEVEIDGDRTVMVSVSGTSTIALPELTVPEDLTSHLPPNGIGLDELGLGGGAGRGGPFGSDGFGPGLPGSRGDEPARSGD